MARREFAAAIHPGAPLTQVRRLAAGPKNGAMRRCLLTSVVAQRF
ncbi:hypothetical protein I549_4871 [Mycobacterium avium subsp. avium 2285 (R)]|nr:hypothetical protein L837_2460 [Mycobacterium avium MAV_061107_1842]ETZ56906.1 hypothetical protein L840_3621 [Mycobacterium sp. MAC_011194_8550]ETZ72123.1 hypothetical protein L841_1271 [Mycobacterium sp. MAC_080597_8934]EUA39236.1 hypothetical protein I549_4871 [Mycobacterium avium subsp. avium 2285 (R)]